MMSDRELFARVFLDDWQGNVLLWLWMSGVGLVAGLGFAP